MTVRAILFDADGVIVNGERASVAFERDFGITSEMTRPFFRGAFLDCLVGKADLKESIAPHLSGWGWQDNVDDFIAFWFKAEHQLNDDLLADIARYRVRGILCYLATNQEPYRTEYLAGPMGLGACFDGIFSSAYVGHMKDSVAFFEQVARALYPIPPHEMLFWDDSVANVDTAQRAGLHAELYQDISDFRMRMAAHLAPDKNADA